jgi:sugar phosphate isomerase/epimerase
MQLGIFAKTFSAETPALVLSQVADAGYMTTQYNMACSGLGALPMTITTQQAGAIQDAAQRSNVDIVAISATYNMIDPNLARRAAGRASFKAIAETAHIVGSNLLTVCTGSNDANDQWKHHPENDSAASWKTMCEECEELLLIAESSNVTIGVEPEHSNVVSSAAVAHKLLDTFNSSRLRIVLDPANLIDAKQIDQQLRTISEAIDLLGPAIALAHAKDVCGNGKFAAAGQGALDWPHYIKELRRAGFNGALIAHGLSAAEAPASAAFLSHLLAKT